LNEIRIDSSKQKFDNINTVTQENMVECLEQSRQKLKLMMKEMKEDPVLYAEAFKHVRGENYNSASNYHSKNKKSLEDYKKDAAIMASMNHQAHGKVQ
jgi:transposase-like protein